MKINLTRDQFASYLYSLFREYSHKTDSSSDKIVWLYFDEYFDVFLPEIDAFYSSLETCAENDVLLTVSACIHRFSLLEFDNHSKILHQTHMELVWKASRFRRALEMVVEAATTIHYARNAKVYLRNQISYPTLRRVGIFDTVDEHTSSKRRTVPGPNKP